MSLYNIRIVLWIRQKVGHVAVRLQHNNLEEFRSVFILIYYFGIIHSHINLISLE